jgi:hypothetical protein
MFFCAANGILFIMKNYFTGLLRRAAALLAMTIILCTSAVYAVPANKNAVILDKIEGSLFGFNFPNETEELRLNRIEQEVYGKANAGTTVQRLTKLGKDLAAGNIGKEIKPKEDTFADDSDKIVEAPKQKQKAPNSGVTTGAGAGVDYPAVNELEKLVFNKEFKEKDLNVRLAQLEQKTFKKTYANDDFNARMERLRGKLKPPSLMNNAIAQSSNNYFDDEPITLSRDYNLPAYQSPGGFDYDDYNAQNSQFSYAKAPKKVNLSAIENSMFRQSFGSDSTENRLARIEGAMFGATFDSDDQHERINRVGSAYSAQKSAKKYDSNKFTQNMSTGLQIGMFILMMLACIL